MSVIRKTNLASLINNDLVRSVIQPVRQFGYPLNSGMQAGRLRSQGASASVWTSHQDERRPIVRVTVFVLDRNLGRA